MPPDKEFEFYATNAQGQVQLGKLSTSDRDAALKDLRSQGLQVFLLTEKGKAQSAKNLYGGVRPEDFVSFNTHLVSITKSGRPLPEGLRVLLAEMRRGSFKSALEDVLAGVQQGKSFSAALAQRSDVFSPLYISLVRAGEASGNMSGVLNMVTRQSSNLLQVRRRVIEALIYPSILLVAVMAVYAFISFKVVPSFQMMFAEMRLELPWATQFVILVSQKAIAKSVCALVLLPLAFLWIFGGRTDFGNFVLEGIVSLVPIARTIGHSYMFSQFCATLAMLLRGGVRMPDALEIVAGASGSRRLQRAIAQVGAEVSEGATLSESLKKTGVFPPTLTWMISLGEGGGDLPAALSDLAQLYESRATRVAAVLDLVLMPFLVLGTGILVMGTVMGIFLPFVSLMEKLGG